MPLTVDELKAAAKTARPIGLARPGGFYLEPEVPVISIETREEMLAYRVVDGTGYRHTNCFTARGHEGWWYDIEGFELKK